jgi:isocitrate dehydrogenase (NAD+)
VTLIPGDGIGPELAEATRRVLDASGVKFDWEVVEAGEAVMEKEGTPLPQSVLDSIIRNKVAIKGPITTPVGVGFRSVNVALRQSLNLYANLRPVRSIPGLKTRYESVDLVIVRENTEDLYAGIEHMVGPDSAESIKIITRAASERIARYAFEYAVANGRRKVTAVHKANIMKLSDGLFLESCRTIAALYEGLIAFEDRIVDNMCMQLVQKPELYDVLVLPNLYGDIVSDLCAGLVGGLGVAPGANIGTEAAACSPKSGSVEVRSHKVREAQCSCFAIAAPRGCWPGLSIASRGSPSGSSSCSTCWTSTSPAATRMCTTTSSSSTPARPAGSWRYSLERHSCTTASTVCGSWPWTSGRG